jgi:hypothetical protein
MQTENNNFASEDYYKYQLLLDKLRAEKVELLNIINQ